MHKTKRAVLFYLEKVNTLSHPHCPFWKPTRAKTLSIMFSHYGKISPFLLCMYSTVFQSLPDIWNCNRFNPQKQTWDSSCLLLSQNIEKFFFKKKQNNFTPLIKFISVLENMIFIIIYYFHMNGLLVVHLKELINSLKICTCKILIQSLPIDRACVNKSCLGSHKQSSFKGVAGSWDQKFEKR